MKALKRVSRLLVTNDAASDVVTSSSSDEEMQQNSPRQTVGGMVLVKGPGTYSNSSGTTAQQQQRRSPRYSSASPLSSLKYVLLLVMAAMAVTGLLNAHLRDTATQLSQSTGTATNVSRPAAHTTQQRSSVLSTSTVAVAPAQDKVVAAETETTKATATTTTAAATATNENDKQCTVWMAPSSLKGDFSGFGIYVTRDLAKGESVLGAPDGVGVPVSSSIRSRHPNAAAAIQWQNWFGEYVWARGVPEHVAYESPPGTVDYQTGMGSLPNHHCILSYLDTIYPNPSYDDSLVNRFRDPSAGSFSYNRGREFVVQHEVKAGDELFLNYGMCSPEVRQGGWTDQLLITEDFVQAASIVSRTRYESSTSSSTAKNRGNERGGSPALLTFDPTTGAAIISPSVNQRVANLLPKSRDEFRDMLVSQARDTTTDQKELVRQIALHSLHRRTPDWIRQHGLCLENLVGRPSTLPLAGHGAFAQRTIPAGDVVTPAPLLQIMDKEALKIYDRNGTTHLETQLLLNYCFGHARSTLLLCPNTNAVLINHCSLRNKECGPEGPNAHVRWASSNSSWDTTTSKWLNMTIQEIAQQSGHGLAFEIVATRDIRPNEEVFIDYGVEWEEAWAEHVKHYQPPPMPFDTTTTPWITAKEANDQEGPILDAFVSGDLRKMVNHPYLFTGCQYWESNWDHHRVYQSPYDSWENLSDPEILSTFADSGHYYSQLQAQQFQSGRRSRRLLSLSPYSKHHDMTYWPCSVLRPETPNGMFYTVRMHRPFFVAEQDWEYNNVPRLVTNYSRNLIHYFVKPYQSDQHLPGVFRHAIGFHDDIVFPEQWKNLP